MILDIFFPSQWSDATGRPGMERLSVLCWTWVQHQEYTCAPRCTANAPSKWRHLTFLGGYRKSSLAEKHGMQDRGKTTTMSVNQIEKGRDEETKEDQRREERTGKEKLLCSAWRDFRFAWALLSTTRNDLKDQWRHHENTSVQCE